MTTRNAINVDSVATVNGQAVTASTAGGYSLATIPGKNMLINGDFQVWQRGAGGNASFTAVTGGTTQYTADRWQFQVSVVGGSGACSQVAGATSGSYLCRAQRTVGNAVAGGIQLTSTLTRDMCIGANSTKVTLSFKARAGADFSSPGNHLTVNLYSGTGNTDVSVITGFTGQATEFNNGITLTNTLTNFSMTSNVLGANVTQLAVLFNYVSPAVAAGAADYFDITDVQLEISPVQTPFDRKTFSQSLLACQRFYFKTFLYGTVPAQAAGAGTGEVIFAATKAGALFNVSSSYALPTNMRTTPSLTTYNPVSANAQIRDYEVNQDFTGTTATSQNGVKNIAVSGTANAATVVGDRCLAHFTAETELT